MTKIIKLENVNTEFNIYHKYLIKKYKNKTIKKFNKRMKEVIQEGKNRVTTYYIKPYMSSDAKTLSKEAMKLGYQQGIDEISEKYPIKETYELIGGHIEYFDLGGK